jgi:hypothetical protein
MGATAAAVGKLYAKVGLQAPPKAEVAGCEAELGVTLSMTWFLDSVFFLKGFQGV